MGRVGPRIGSQRAYGRHRGVTHGAVQRAIKAGRIPVRADGRIDFDKADLAWEVNTSNGARAPEPVLDERQAAALTRARGTYAAARAGLAQLAYLKRSGKLVEVADVTAEIARYVRLAHDRVLGIPDRVSPLIPGRIADEIRALLQDEINDAIEGLGGKYGDGGAPGT